MTHGYQSEPTDGQKSHNTGGKQNNQATSNHNENRVLEILFQSHTQHVYLYSDEIN